MWNSITSIGPGTESTCKNVGTEYYDRCHHSTGMDTGGAHDLRNEWPGEVHRHITSIQGQKARDFVLWSAVSGAVIPLCLCSMRAALSDTRTNACGQVPRKGCYYLLSCNSH